MTQSKLLPLGKCPACKTLERKFLFSVHQSNIYSCSRCHMRYLDPCLPQDAMSELYESNEELMRTNTFYKNYYGYGSLSKSSKTLRDYRKTLKIMEELFKRPPSSLSILDVGYGNGFFLAAAKERGWSVDGIDSSFQNSLIARERFNLNLKAGDFIAADLPKNHYNVIAAWDVLEHFYQPEVFLQKINDLLAPGGLIMIAVPNDFSFLRIVSEFLFRLSRGKIRTGLEKTYVMEHTSYYTSQTLKSLLVRHGFLIKKYFFSRTDLKRYNFSFKEKLMAGIILIIGKILCLENRLIMIGQRPATKNK